MTDHTTLAMLGRAGIGVAVARGDGTLVTANDAFCRLLGRTHDALVGTSLDAHVIGEDRDELARALRGVAQSELTETTMLSRYATPDGAIRIGRTSLLLESDAPGEPTVAAVVEDVTQLEHAPELADLLACLRHEQQVHEQFVSDVAHDLRTPLTVISAELQLLHNHYHGDPETRRIVARLMNELKRVDHLAGNLLLLSKLDTRRAPSAPKRVSLDSLAIESLETYATVSAQKGIHWRIDIADEVDVLADASSLQRALTNVIDNAVKYVAANGVIEMKLKAGDGTAVLSVVDDGPGIPTEELDRVCERFYRGAFARDKPGTGLGLAIVRQVIESHGGTVRIASDVGAGTHVRLSLPIAPQGAA
jgi:PAS domain S-box-containing protein